MARRNESFGQICYNKQMRGDEGMEYQEIEFVKINPAENTTIFVISPVEKEKRAETAKKLMSYGSVQAEQVGFITRNPAEGIDGHVEMMGGEFCANASRSLAAYLAFCGQMPQEDGFYRITCSGCETIMLASVEKSEIPSVMKAEIRIPLPRAIDPIALDVDGQPAVFYRTAFAGITHYVLPNGGGKCCESCWQAVKKWADEDSYDALGMIAFDLDTEQMKAAVYVKETDTLYWERSCGSGTAALGAVLAVLEKDTISIPVRQEGGTIEVTAYCKDGRLKTLLIGGEVEIAAKGTAYIRL